MNQKTVKRMLCLLLAVLMLALAACGGSTGGGTTGGSTTGGTTTTTDSTGGSTATDGGAAAADDGPAWMRDTSPITLDWYVNMSWFSYDWGTTLISKYVQEKTGVSINFIVPAGNENEKLNTMIAANSLPDVVTLGWWEEGVRKMVEGELVYSLNELADQYDPYFYEVANEQLLGWYQMDDGKTYGYANFSVTPSDFETARTTSNQSFMVRKDMYEAIGSPEMRTPEGFLAALQKAAETFPEVNGQPLIPFGAHEFGDTGCYTFERYLANFLAIPMGKDGKLYDWKNDPEYLNWLKVFRKANELGLISTDVFIDKRAQMEEKIAQGRYFSMLYQNSDMVSGQQALWDKDPNTAYMAIDGPANSNMDDARVSGPAIAGWTLSLITKNCKNPERAIGFFSYWISDEGQRDFYLGEEGVIWDMVDGKETMKTEYADMMQNNRDEHNKVVGQDSLWMLGNSLIQANWAPGDAPSMAQMKAWTEPYTVSYTEFDNIDPPGDSEEGIIKSKIDQAWGLALPKMLMAASDEEFDQLYQNFYNEKIALGFEKLEAYQQAKYEENLRKLGMQ